MLEQIKLQTKDIAVNLKVHGLLNIQYAIKDEKLYVIEVNPRASRTVPFVAKATGVPLIKLTVQVLLGRKLWELDIKPPKQTHYAVKEVVFPFARFATADVTLAPEMKSTGEVMGLDVNPDIAFAKAQIAANNFTNLIKNSKVLLLCATNDKKTSEITELLTLLSGCDCYTDDKKNTLSADNLITRTSSGKLKQMLENNEFDFAILFGDNPNWKELRRMVILGRVPYCSTLEGALAYIKAAHAYVNSQISITPLQSLNK